MLNKLKAIINNDFMNFSVYKSFLSSEVVQQGFSRHGKKFPLDSIRGKL